MTPRADEPPRRGTPSRRGAARDLPPEADPARSKGFGGIGDARAYTPRGRTVAERDQRTRSPRAARTTDPFRPALQVLDGGETTGRARGRSTGEPAPAGRVTKSTDGPPPEPAGARRGTKSAGKRAPEPAAVRRPAKSSGERSTEPIRQRRPGKTGAPASARTAGGRTGNKGRDRTVAAASAPRRTAGGRRPGPRRPAPAVPAAPPRLASSSRRLRLATVLALTLFATIGIRLVVLQVVESPDEAQRLLEQRQNRLTEVVLPAPRGSILDRSGAVLAHSVEARYIYADPELVQDPAGAALKLSPLLGVAPSTLVQLMAKKKRPGGGWSRFEYLARGVDIAVADRIAAMNLPGIREDRDERRDVPGADLAANLIGFTGEDHTGLEGLEARYDDLLRGTDGEKVYETGNPNVGHGELAKEIPGGYHRETPAQPGTSLALTIDRDLQFEVQRYLSDDMRRVDATIGAAVVLDIHTGEVLAQASYPAYNAAKPFDAKPVDREDVASSVVADPGSSHKPFVLGAALQEGIITPTSTVTVGPALMRGGYRFQDTHPQPKGTKLTIPGVLAYSSNVGTILIGDKLGAKRIYEYQQKFGLGQATGEGMPGEATGRILAPDEWSGSASGSVPIGMSVDATLIQMAAAYAAIANDGTYVQPHLISSTIAPDGTVTPAPRPETHQVLSPAVATQLRTMMEAVVDVKGATGTQAAVNGYRVAGKTGTGKRLVDGRYTRYNAGSFVGMAPADNPRFVIGVFADVPNGTGGSVAAPAFSNMMSFALAHYRVPPSGTKAPKFKIYP
jgi:cell division protein FtsI (penicillin-binding protein 3)